MKFTMRDKICKLIGKYNELEQQAMVNVAGGAFRTMLGKMPTKEEENASEKASIYHWMQEDLKQLLEEDEAPCRPPQDRPGGQVVRGLSGTGSCELRKGGAEQWVKH